LALIGISLSYTVNSPDIESEGTRVLMWAALEF
jgi:hypothetical protein